MSEFPTAEAGSPGWTCPFCSLLCEGLGLKDGAATLQGTACPRALGALASHRLDAGLAGGVPSACVDGQPAPLDAALQAASERLAAWRAPLFGGLGTDVAGARALFRLAAATNAVCDHADGAAMLPGLRAQQDRGQFTTTLGEVRSRADVIVCVGTDGTSHYPEFFRRLGLDAGLGAGVDDSLATSPCKSLVFLGAAPPAGAPRVLSLQHLPGSGDLFADIQQLAARVDQRRLGGQAPEEATADQGADAALSGLANRLRHATYAVLVYEGATLGAEGALLVEMLNRIVTTLNRKTRAALFSLGGSHGAYGVNQTFTWLSGLPLRTHLSPAGLVHEPHLFNAGRLLARGGVDGLLWISSFTPDRLPPPTALPRIVLGPPAMLGLMDAAAQTDCVFIPVATPGLNAAGHVFRTDGTVVLPLVAVRDDGLPGVAQVLAALLAKLAPSTSPPMVAVTPESTA